METVLQEDHQVLRQVLHPAATAAEDHPLQAHIAVADRLRQVAAAVPQEAAVAVAVDVDNKPT